MEILQVKSSSILTSSVIATRAAGIHSYNLNCRQFMTDQRNWARVEATRGLPMGVTTLDFERIWITAEEVTQITDAIKATRTPLTLS